MEFLIRPLLRWVEDSPERLPWIVRHRSVDCNSHLEDFTSVGFDVQIDELSHPSEGDALLLVVVGLLAPVLVEAYSPLSPGEAGNVGVSACVSIAWASTPI